MTVDGSPRDFSARIQITDPDEVWRRWTSPASWGQWDRGLRSAELPGPFVPGATGTITGLDGRRSRFTVDAVDDGHSVGYHIRLPGARMELIRTIAGANAEHRVRFRGPTALIWAAILGRRFRPLLEPTMVALVAHGPDRE